MLDQVLTESTLFENYSSSSYNALLKSLKTARDTIIKDLEKQELSIWTKNRLSRLLKLVDKEIKIAYANFLPNFKVENVEVANTVYGYYLGELGIAVPVEVSKDIVSSKRRIQGYTFEELFKYQNHSNKLKKLLSDELKVYIASGNNLGKGAKEIVRKFDLKNEQLSKGQITSNIRTVIAESRRAARSESYRVLEEEGVITGYEYFATLDNRTTDWCENHDNRKYKTLQGINKDLNTHFNCRSVALPLTGNEAENKRNSNFGTNKRNNYESWYNSKSDNFHKSTLTNLQYNEYINGSYNVQSLNDISKKQSLINIARTFRESLS